jgi:hypothetical protein
MQASLTKSGVSISGSPAPKLIISIPFAFSSLALALTAKVGDGFNVLTLSASIEIL